MGAPEPPSPGPSADEVFHSSPVMAVPVSTAYPYSPLAYDDTFQIYSLPQSRYDTPFHDEDSLGFGSSPAYPQPQDLLEVGISAFFLGTEPFKLSDHLDELSRQRCVHGDYTRRFAQGH